MMISSVFLLGGRDRKQLQGGNCKGQQQKTRSEKYSSAGSEYKIDFTYKNITSACILSKQSIRDKS